MPEFPAEKGALITVSHLLNHRSGVTGEGRIPELDEIERHRWTREELLQEMAGRDLVFAPGTRSEYSNYGYFLLGIIIERAGGASYADQLWNRICEPAGMTRTRQIIEVEDFHAKTERGVKQEVFAQFVLITMNRLFANRADIALNADDPLGRSDECPDQGPSYGTKTRLQTNFKNCIHVLSRSLEELLLLQKSMRSIVQRAFDAIAGQYSANAVALGGALSAQRRGQDSLESFGSALAGGEET